MKITIVGTGYVGLSNAMLLSDSHDIIALDIDPDKIDLLNQRVSPIEDDLIQEYLLKAKQFSATTSQSTAFENAEIIIIATPTNYDEHLDFFDTSSIESCLKNLEKYNHDAKVIIKSTVPVGFTEKIKKQYPNLNIIFSPEFLREGKALYDNLYPSRIVVGDKTDVGKEIGQLFLSASLNSQTELLLLNATEAEAVKLFSNTYLAMRVSYFNELDSYCAIRGLNTKDIINAVGLDPRIGNHYNNPSFGYGGYCLPKDTKQLLANYRTIPQNLIGAIIDSNETRKNFITEQILNKKPTTIGVYRLIMKQGSDNFRESAIIDIIKKLLKFGINIIIYEPGIQKKSFLDLEIINNLNTFKHRADLILTNRMVDELNDVKEKVYTRDVFGNN